MTDRAQNGKGSTRRRTLVDDDSFRSNWDRIFSKEKKMWTVTYSTFSGVFEAEFEDEQEAREFYDEARFDCFGVTIRED